MTRRLRPAFPSMTCQRRQRGFTLIEVIVTSAIMASLALVVVSSMNSQIVSAKKNQCMASLQVIESAKNAWVGDHPGQTMPTPPFSASGTQDPLLQYTRGGVVPSVCPSSATTAYTNVYDPTAPAACSFHKQQAYPTPTP